LKILHVVHNYHPSVGGTQHTMKHLSEYFASNKDTVSVYTTDSYYGPNNILFKEIPVKEEIINNVAIKRFHFSKLHQPFIKLIKKIFISILKFPFPYSLANLLNGPYSPSMKRAILESDADVICASSIHFMFADYPLWRKKTKYPKPFVLYGALHIHNYNDIPGAYLKRIKLCDKYIANTQFEKDYLIKKGIESSKIDVIGAATNIEISASELPDNKNLKSQLGISAYSKTVLCLSRQESWKGIMLLVDAFINLQNTEKDICLLLAGFPGNCTEKLLKISKYHPSVKVINNFSDQDKCYLLKLADVIVLPSKEESLGLVFLEAWSMKKPVIGADIGAISSVISDNIDGKLFKQDNVEDLSKCILQLINNDKKRESLGEAGYKKVQEFYTWNKVAANFRKAYLDAILNFKNKSTSN
jgi:glycosyltransferase involved in cell wall biosynthesis